MYWVKKDRQRWMERGGVRVNKEIYASRCCVVIAAIWICQYRDCKDFWQFNLDVFKPSFWKLQWKKGPFVFISLHMSKHNWQQGDVAPVSQSSSITQAVCVHCPLVQLIFHFIVKKCFPSPFPCLWISPRLCISYSVSPLSWLIAGWHHYNICILRCSYWSSTTSRCLGYETLIKNYD